MALTLAQEKVIYSDSALRDRMSQAILKTAQAVLISTAGVNMKTVAKAAAENPGNEVNKFMGYLSKNTIIAVPADIPDADIQYVVDFQYANIWG